MPTNRPDTRMMISDSTPLKYTCADGQAEAPESGPRIQQNHDQETAGETEAPDAVVHAVADAAQHARQPVKHRSAPSIWAP